MKKTPKSAARTFFAALLSLALVLLLLPLFWGIVRASLLLVPLVAAGLVMVLRPAWALRLRGKHPRLWRAAAALLLSALAVCLALSAAMAAAAAKPAYDDGSVIVLGCQIVDGAPSRMLRARLDRAFLYLEAHPQAAVVVSGGQGSNEDEPEAAVMRRYLISRGIAPGRILCEDRAQNTAQNLAFSAALLQEKGLGTRVVLATDAFHQLRAALFAKRCGLDPSAASCASEPGLAFGYWCREMIGISRALILGY